MPGAPTPNLGLTVPTVGSDFNIWGTELNSDLAILDQLGVYAGSAVSASGLILLGVAPETFILGTGGALGITLTTPPPVLFKGRVITIKKVDGGVGAVVVLAGAGAIDGFPNYTLFNQNQYVRLFSDGANLQVVGNN
jgi:hypothetical protein